MHKDAGMSINAARQLHAELIGYVNALPDRPGQSPMDVADKFEETDRIINSLREVVSRQTVILGQLISAWPTTNP